MKRLLSLSSILTTLCIFVLLFTISCAPKHMAPPDSSAINLGSGSQLAGYTPKVDAFLLILDASSSMAEPYNAYTKFDVAKAFVTRMNNTLPPLPIKAGLRSFGHHMSITKKPLALYYPMGTYDKIKYNAALDKLTRAGGTSPMAKAIDAAAEDLEQISGKIAVILVADAVTTGDNPLKAAQRMKRTLGNRVCIYTVQTGNSKEGKILLNQIANTGGCGFAVSAADIDSATAMVGYVKKVFFNKKNDRDGDGVYDNQDQCPNTPAMVKVDPNGCALDTDGDGVPDYKDKCLRTPKGDSVDADGCTLIHDRDGDGITDNLDQCPNTPKGAAVDAHGCALDSDNDGVADYKDNCPDTPKGANVNANGCWTLANVQFDSGKATIPSETHSGLDNALQVLQHNPAMRIEIQGHTDNVGSKRFNQQLSEKRAKAVMNYFLEKGMDASRLSYKGYGPSRPIANNATAEGKAKNRRVELKPIQ